MNDETSARGTVRAALGHRDFRVLMAGQAISQIGDFLYNVALVAYVFSMTNSAVWAGLTSAARIVPMLVFGPFGGVIADRFNRRVVLVTCDLVRGLLMLGLGFVAEDNLPLIACPLIAALATAAAAPSMPAAAAMTPRLVPDEDLPGANATRSTIGAMAVIVGPAVGGLLLLVNPASAFAVNAATFGVSALCIIAVRDSGAFAAARRADGAASRGGVLGGIVGGAKALRGHPAALWLIGADMMCSFVFGMTSVLYVMVAMDAGLDMHGYGFMFAAVGAGGLVATVLASRTTRLPYRGVLIAALVAVGLANAGLAATQLVYVILALAAVSGCGSLLVEVMMDTGLQRMVPQEVFGAAYGLAIPASIGVIGVGSLVAPVINDALGTGGAMEVCGAVAIGYAVILLLARPGRPGRRAALAGMRAAGVIDLDIDAAAA